MLNIPIVVSENSETCNRNNLNIIKEVGLRSMRVKYKEKNSSLCQNGSDVSLAMGLPTSSGFIKLKRTK